MLWVLMSVIVVVAGFLVLRRRKLFESAEDEPWRASLKDHDEPLDVDEARRAEEDWLAENDWEDLPEDESWR